MTENTDLDNEEFDTYLLDCLDGLEVPAGMSWCMRPSTRGRGWRLHTISKRQAEELGVETFGTAREALESFFIVDDPII